MPKQLKREQTGRRFFFARSFLKRPAQQPSKVIVVTQHFAPNQNTTAAIMTTIAKHLAIDRHVLVLSGTAIESPLSDDLPRVIQIRSKFPPKTALLKRMAYEILFSLRALITVLLSAKRGDVVLTVTAPFVLPYAAVAAAAVKGARSILIVHDLYPDVLIIAGMVRRTSLVARLIEICNKLLFDHLDAAVTIGTDTERLLQRYKGATPDKLHFIPNWPTLPIHVRSYLPNRYRTSPEQRLVIGLSGNLGFTHDADIVFEAARLLRDDPRIHFLLSGWGMGFDTLQDQQAEEALANVTIIDRVPEHDLEELLAAADAWIIPYRKNMAGVSVPSRFYNILAVGRPVILVSETDAEAARLITDHDVGWVTPPEDAHALAELIGGTSLVGSARSKGEQTTRVAKRHSIDAAMQKYRSLVATMIELPK